MRVAESVVIVAQIGTRTCVPRKYLTTVVGEVKTIYSR